MYLFYILSIILYNLTTLSHNHDTDNKALWLRNNYIIGRTSSLMSSVINLLFLLLQCTNLPFD